MSGASIRPAPQRFSRAFAQRRFESVRQHFVFYFALLMLGATCLAWLPFAAALRVLLPRRTGRVLGRAVIRHVWRLYFHMLSALGAARFDLTELSTLRGGPRR